ncbi:low-complexity tail membrane protein [Synechocystis sp. LKSZ1]|uniref:low-complexity tail membrane protein n=1 Tax=Synechocystis sp. LKSZ1 TaxID=3144951 RepID=UPI00336BB282
MSSFRTEPFLWIHLAGVAVAPLALLVAWVALAVATPVTPYALELLLLVGAGMVPVFWMQWQRPFEIFSLLLIALRPDQLSEAQRRILALFLRPQRRWLTLLGALLLLVKLGVIYYYAPLAAMVALELPQVRLLALLVAAVAFFMANLFLQVPLSVLGVLLTSQDTYEATQPLESTEVQAKFTIPGFRVRALPWLTAQQ